jgi:hypothetical protein
MSSDVTIFGLHTQSAEPSQILYLSYMKNNTTQTDSNLFAVADQIANGSTLFRAGFKAEVYWGDEIVAHHLPTRSVYRFKENDNVSIIHDAPFVNDEAKDRFSVCVRTEHNPRHSTTATVETFDNWLDAYYCGVQCVNNLNIDAMIMS